MPRERVIASLTIGPTAVMMLIVRRYADGRWEYINEVTASTGLAEHIDTDSVLDLSAINRTVPAIRDMYAIAAEEGVERVIIVGASALNKAKNKAEFIYTCREILDLPYIEILSEREEAELSYLGATADLKKETHYLLIDLGGSSTEVVFGTQERCEGAHSLNMGYLDLTHRFGLDKFLIFLHRHGAERYIQSATAPVFQSVSEWLHLHQPKIVVSGAIASSIVGLRNKELVMDRKQVAGAVSDVREVWNLYRLIARTFPASRINLPGIERDRVRMIPGALLLLSTLLNLFHLETFTISAGGLRMGLLRRFEVMEETEMAVASLNSEFF